MKYDDIVIGAGVSGLSAAILLAQKGRSVAVVEKAPVVAPTIRGFVKEGIYFDTGFHYASMLAEGQAMARLFERLGILPHLRVRQNGQGSGDLLLHTPSEFQLPFGDSLQDLTEQLTGLFPDEANAIQYYFSDVKTLLEQVHHSLFGLLTNPSKIFENTDVSLGNYLRTHFNSSLLQTILSIHSILYGSQVEETSLRYHSMVAGGYYDRTQQIYNGGRAIAQAFEKELTKNQIALFLNNQVERICLDDSGAVRAIALENGENFECANCITTAHPRLLIGMLPKDAFRPIYRNRLINLEDTSSAVVLYCRKKDPDKKIDFHNIILAQSLFPDLYGNQTDSDHCPVFVSHSISDNHAEGVSIICPWNHENVRMWEDSEKGRRDPAYYDWKRQIADEILNRTMESIYEFIGPLDVVDVASPLTFRDYMHAPKGCLYGAKHRVSDMPLMPRTRIRGLYLSGQSILASGVMGAMLSGFLSAAFITGEDYRETMDLL